MVKKKIKKAVKKKTVKKVKRVLKSKKAKVKAPAKSKEKVLGKIDHFFDKISVAALRVKAPFKTGDWIHIKGHTTDFIQKVESMQIEHDIVAKVKKGDDVGLKVKEYVRDHDLVYLASEPKETVLPKEVVKPMLLPQPLTLPKETTPPPAPKKADPYSGTKFLKF